MSAKRSNTGAKGLLLLPWLILLVTLALTWFVWDHERQSTRKEMKSQFDFVLRETVSRVEQRVAAYEQMLRGVQGLFTTTGLMNRNAVHDYVEALQLDANFSGVQVIGVAQRVPLQGKADHVTAMRRFGFADYMIHPVGQNEIHAPIIQREPDVGRKLASLGFDLWTDPVRRVAMERARDSGMAAISGMVHLAVDDDPEAPPGFIMYLPVFEHGQAHDSVAERRNHLIGWVYAAFHMSDFMASLYGKQAPGIDVSIYDDVAPEPSRLMYRYAENGGGKVDTAAAALGATEYMVVAGHAWTLALKSEPEFGTRFGRDAATVIAATGVGLSLLLAVLVWLMVTGRARALRLAAQMTEELRHMAQHDTLTNLPNRALASEIRYG